jgi:arylsulfatase A-like enzyme
LDASLGRLLSSYDGADFVIVSDHGVHDAHNLGRRLIQHAFGCPGLFLAYGPHVKSGRAAAVSMYDLMPTLASFLGVPVARDLDGHVDPRFLMLPADTSTIATYRGVVPNRKVAPRGDGDWTQERERLKALGYIR